MSYNISLKFINLLLYVSYYANKVMYIYIYIDFNNFKDTMRYQQ